MCSVRQRITVSSMTLVAAIFNKCLPQVFDETWQLVSLVVFTGTPQNLKF